MTGAIIVTLIAFAIVVSYMATVNWFLRHDEHYNEGNPVPVPKPVRQVANSSAVCATGIPARV